MKTFRIPITALLILVCLIAEAAWPAGARAYSSMTISDAGLELIKRYESFSAQRYYDAGRWYVGYGTLIGDNEYVDGISESEAVRILRAELATHESVLNSFFARNDLHPSQQQFDALVSFTYNSGSAWLSGSNDLVKIVCGDMEASRRDTVRAFAIWSHAGGAVLPGLARRRIEEAALYLDGTTGSKDDFCYLAIERESGVTYTTDLWIYERGGTYDVFPAMIRLGYTLTGFHTKSGRTIQPGDTVSQSESVAAVWEKNRYETRSFKDVRSGAWYYDYVMTLSEAAVIDGRQGGFFDPDDSVTVGEALKLLLLAAGNDAQDADGDGHWAGGYARLARENRFLPDALLDELDRPITRVQVAQLAARALGYCQSFSDSPFADVDNPYVTALSELGVLDGTTAHGENVYYPNEPLSRAEIAAIIWRLQSAAELGKRQTVRYASRDFAVASGVALNTYNKDGFSGNGKEMTYTEPDVTVLRGIDVSSWQGEIDWSAVAADGIDFAILRAGYRGQTVGDIYPDNCFEEYYAGAKTVGLRIGVYFYSQAVNTAEAIEEADYVLRMLSGKEIDGPIIFDWETAGSDNPTARSNDVPVSIVCDCAVAFCEHIREAGYTPMIYMNTYDGYIKYDLSRLTDYDVWYAGQYNGDYPRFIYDFSMWQYTSSSEVDGISGGVDMDLWFFR